MNECYGCQFRMDIPGDAHSMCAVGIFQAQGRIKDVIQVSGSTHGTRSGWFAWPYNYDPVWLESCNIHDFLRKELENENAQNQN